MNDAINHERAYRVLGITDDHTTCDFCGKADLRCTVAFEPVDGGEVVYAGTTCAAYVRLMILDEHGEVKPRTAPQILTLAKRAALEREAADLEAGIRFGAAAACGKLRSWYSTAGYGFLYVDEHGRVCASGMLGWGLVNAFRWFWPAVSDRESPAYHGIADRLSSLPRQLPARIEALRALTERTIAAWAKVEAEYAKLEGREP